MSDQLEEYLERGMYGAKENKKRQRIFPNCST